MFSSEIYETCKNTYFEEHLQTTAYDYRVEFWEILRFPITHNTYEQQFQKSLQKCIKKLQFRRTLKFIALLS